MQKSKQNYGRTMLEMLGVLAIIGILTAVGLSMYKNAIYSHKANIILNDARMIAATVLQKETIVADAEKVISTAEYKPETSYDIYALEIKAKTTFAVEVKNVEEGVCKAILDKAGSNYSIEVQDTIFDGSNTNICKAENSVKFMFDLTGLCDPKCPTCCYGVCCASDQVCYDETHSCGPVCKDGEKPFGTGTVGGSICCPEETKSVCGGHCCDIEKSQKDEAGNLIGNICCGGSCCYSGLCAGNSANGKCCNDGQMICNGDCYGACPDKKMVRSGENCECVCPEPLILNEDKTECICPTAEAPYMFEYTKNNEDKYICCPGSNTVIDGKCVPFVCNTKLSGKCQDGDCYICALKNKVCGYFCTSEADYCCGGVCLQERCPDSSKLRLHKYNMGGYNWGCYVDNNNDGEIDNNDTCYYHSQGSGTLICLYPANQSKKCSYTTSGTTTGSCDNTVCNRFEGKATYGIHSVAGDNRGGCFFDLDGNNENDIFCVPVYSAGSKNPSYWMCYDNEKVLCDGKCTNPPSCGGNCVVETNFCSQYTIENKETGEIKGFQYEYIPESDTSPVKRMCCSDNTTRTCCRATSEYSGGNVYRKDDNGIYRWIGLSGSTDDCDISCGPDENNKFQLLPNRLVWGCYNSTTQIGCSRLQNAGVACYKYTEESENKYTYQKCGTNCDFSTGLCKNPILMDCAIASSSTTEEGKKRCPEGIIVTDDSGCVCEDSAGQIDLVKDPNSNNYYCCGRNQIYSNGCMVEITEDITG